jgi:hypothetical protein
MGERRHGSNLDDFAKLASWPTPRAEERQQHNSGDDYVALSKAVKLVSWPTPTVNDSKGSDYSYGNGDHERVCL